MKVLFFVQVRAFTGCGQTHLEVPNPVTAAQLWERLEERFPGIAKFQSSTRLARNFSYAGDDQTFTDQDEVALVSPVSGG